MIAAGVGAAARLFDLPVPAPPNLLGVLLIGAITGGYLAADRLLAASKEQVKDANSLSP
jgi:XapX domain-containing protein